MGSDRRQRRESLFTRMVLAFAHGDLAALEEGVRSDVELTLRGSSWLAGSTGDTKSSASTRPARSSCSGPPTGSSPSSTPATR